MSKIVQSDIDNLCKEFPASFSGRKILVTGGAGFLGSWLCEIFAASDAKVTCLDNFSTSTGENIEHLKGRVKLVTRNVEDYTDDESYDFIFNFSSRASPDEYIQHPIETLTTNSIGTMKILDLAKKGGSKLIQASTSEIYGDPQIVPTPETYYGYTNSIGMRSCYDEGKRFSEALCMAYVRQHDLDVRIARIFNSYGPRIRSDGAYGRALPRFISQALRNESITIYGDGKQTRSFCYVTDTVRGILKLATIPRSDKSIVNIGNPNEITILDLADKITRNTKSSSKLSFLPLIQDDPRRRCADIARAKELLDWEPKVDLDDGLSRTIEWFRHVVLKQNQK